MKANELMVGDWVVVNKDVGFKKDTIVEVRGIDSDNKFDDLGLVGSATCLHRDGTWREWCGIWVDYLDGIPITAEILEKNGFIYKDVAHNNFRGVWVCNVGGCNNVFIQFTDKVAIEIHNELGRKDEKGRAHLVSFCRDWCEVLCVHELQHALRLCGIEKEIEI